MTVTNWIWQDYLTFFVNKLVGAPFLYPLKALWVSWEISAGLRAFCVDGAVLYGFCGVVWADDTSPVGVGEVAACTAVVAFAYSDNL